MLLMCSPFRLASKAAWSRRLFQTLCCVFFTSSLESRSLHLLPGRSGARMLFCQQSVLGRAGSAGTRSGSGPTSSSRLSGSSHGWGTAVFLPCLDSVIFRVVVITAGYRAKSHGRGDRVCSVLLCDSECEFTKVCSSFL